MDGEDEHLEIVQNKDIELLYEWANDEECRNNSFNSDSISFDEHKTWFYEKINSDTTYFWIYYRENCPVGQLRLEYHNKIMTISYSISKSYRGRGYAKKLLKHMEEHIRCLNLEIEYVSAKVKFTNIPSQKVFESLGYDRMEKEKYIEYKKML